MKAQTFVSFWLFFSLSCQESDFSGSSATSPKKPAPKGAPGTLGATVGAQSDANSGLGPDGKPITGSQLPGDKTLSRVADAAGTSNLGDSGSPIKIPSSDISKSPDGRITEIFKGETFKKSNSVDIVFALDTSGSMGDERAAVEANMADFISQFEAAAKDIDYQVFVIGDRFNFPISGTKLSMVKRKVDSHDALEAFKLFFEGTIASAVRPRANSIKQLVVVTDDNAKNVGSAEFRAFIESNSILKGKTRVNGFIGLPSSVESSNCEIASVGQEYLRLANDPAVGGLMQDICVSDWNQLLSDLASKILRDVGKTAFSLRYPADRRQPIKITVNGKDVPENAVRYDAASNSLLFAEGSEPAVGAEIEVTYLPSST